MNKVCFFSIWGLNKKETENQRSDILFFYIALKASEEAHEIIVCRLKESLERAKRNKDNNDIKSPEQNNDEKEAMDRIMELLHDENSQLRQKLAVKEEELSNLLQQQPSTPSPQLTHQENSSAAILNPLTEEDSSVEIDVYGITKRRRGRIFILIKLIINILIIFSNYL